MVRKVLFVDDDQIMLLAIEKRFATYSDHFSVLMAHDGFEAVQKLKETAVSLIVLDLKMPRMDGMSLLTLTREKYPDIPVIIVSGYRTAEMYKLAKAKGVIAYISKPFQVDDLGKIIMGTLQKEADGGIMHKVSPTVFLQLMEMEGKSCTIRVVDHKSTQGGILYFHDGQLLDVRIGEIQGINAAYKLFSWDEVTFFIQNECTERENKINSDLQPIIMKAVGMKDEGEEVPDPVEEEFAEAPVEVTAEEAVVAEQLAEASPDSGLSDLELPSDLLEEEDEVEDEKVVEPPPLESPPEETTPQRNSIVHLQETILKQVGANSGVQDIYHDDSLGNIIEFLTELGAMFDFGTLKVAYINNEEETDKIIVPGKPTAVIKVNQKCPQDKIMQVLNTY